MIFNWFDTTEATRFGESLAEFFAQRVPLDGKAGKPHKADKKLQEIYPKLFSQCARFKQEHKLNMFKRAKLANSFKWKLLDLGYAPEFVDSLTKELLLRV